MDGSMKRLVRNYPYVFLAASRGPWENHAPLALLSECQAWAQNAHELCGTPYTIQSWRSLCRHGRELSLRMERFLKT